MAEDQRSARREHDVIVELVAEMLPQLQAEFEEIVQGGKAVIGTHQRRVATDIAAADPAFFEHRNVADAVDLGEIISGGEAMTAAADDDYVIGWTRFGIAP